MVMKPEPLFAALESVLTPDAHVVLMTPQGRTFDQATAESFAGKGHLVFVCGHYEGVDERVRERFVHDELSIGDYVLTNGALPVMVVIDAVTRLLPGVLGDEDSARDDSFSQGLLEYPQYTRPPVFEGEPIPEVLTSGDHAKVAAWRRAEAKRLTAARRPDLWAAYRARKKP